MDIYPSKNSGSLNLLNARRLSSEEFDRFAEELAHIGKQNRLALATCAEAIDLAKHGIKHSSCTDQALIERITSAPLLCGSIREADRITERPVKSYNQGNNLFPPTCSNIFESR